MELYDPTEESEVEEVKVVQVILGQSLSGVIRPYQTNTEFCSPFHGTPDKVLSTVGHYLNDHFHPRLVPRRRRGIFGCLENAPCRKKI